jgi:hypothetical protein
MMEHVLRVSFERNWIITIMYEKAGEITMRNIKVLQMDEDTIKAFCYLRGEQRKFKKKNILSAGFYDRKPINGIGAGA